MRCQLNNHQFNSFVPSLQYLRETDPEFDQALIEAENSGDGKADDTQKCPFNNCFLCNTRELMQEVTINLLDEPVSPQFIYDNIEELNVDPMMKTLIKGRQEDSHEFISLFLSKLQENILNQSDNIKILNTYCEIDNIVKTYQSKIEHGDLNMDDRSFSLLKHFQQKLNDIELELINKIKYISSNKIKFIFNKIQQDLLSATLNLYNYRAMWTTQLQTIQDKINQIIRSSRFAIENTTIISKIFGGKLLSSLECLICGHTSNVIDEFLDISLSVMPSTIELLLEQFTNPTLLDEQNKWYCHVCKKETKSVKQLSFYSIPPILILHLKRFEVLPNGTTVKDIALVNFNDELQMKPFLSSNSNSPNTSYNLYSVICHSSYDLSADDGHYYSMIKHNNIWFKCNDNRIQRCDNYKFDEESYILFWEQCS